MNDFSACLNRDHARVRRRAVQAPPLRPPAARPGLDAAQAAAARVQACARGEQACRVVWMRIVKLGAAGVLALPRDRVAAAAFDAVCAWNVAPYAAIAAEVEHALAHGVRAGSGCALLLLAAIASERFDGGAQAIAVADAAVVLASEHDAAIAGQLHAALMLARRMPFPACLQAFGSGGDADARAASLAAGLRGGAGTPLPELTHALAQAHADAAAARAAPVLLDELAARLALLRFLAAPHCTAASLPEAASFGAAVCRVQLAYYSGDSRAACHAVLAATPLASALAAPADMLCHHLFAALVLARDAAPAHQRAARAHRAALDMAAGLCPANAGPAAALAGAAELASTGDVPGALRSYEAAAALAETHGQTWVAALAWELAADLCRQCAFGVAMPAYRRRALMAWHACGAHGRIAQLCRAWNEAAERRAPAPGAPCAGLAQEDEARRVARAGTVGELGVSIAHEVNQPLAAILLQAAAARRWLRRPQPDLEKALQAIEQIAVSGRRAGDIVRSVQGLARRHANDLTVFPVDAALEEVLRLLARPLRKHGITAGLALTLKDGAIHANRAQVQQVVINLLLNAIDALATVQGRQRHIVLASRRLGAGSIDISVADNGPGVAPADRDHIFSALFSTKTNGTGVGLSISRAIAEAHGGHIEHRPQLPHGAVFSLVLASMRTD